MAGFLGTVVLHASAPVLPAVSSSSKTSPGSGGPGSGGPGSGGPGSGGPGSGGPGSGGVVGPSPLTSSAASPGATAPPATFRSATGTTEQYGYGQLAVRVSVDGTKITGLSLVGLQTAEPYSQQIAAQVVPMLRSEVLAAQTTQVNGISGATYTTDAYLTSLQSALDQLHVQ